MMLVFILRKLEMRYLNFRKIKLGRCSKFKNRFATFNCKSIFFKCDFYLQTIIFLISLLIIIKYKPFFRVDVSNISFPLR